MLSIEMLGRASVLVNDVIEMEEGLPEPIRHELMQSATILMKTCKMLIALEEPEPDFRLGDGKDHICTAINANIRLKCKEYNYSETEDCGNFTIDGYCSKPFNFKFQNGGSFYEQKV